MLNFRLKLLTPTRIIEENILKAAVTEINKRLNTQAFKGALQKRVRDILHDAIMQQPEYQSLISDSGKLRQSLGLEDTHLVDRIVQIWVRGVNVSISPVRILGSSLSGRITIQAIPEDYSDVLGSKSSTYKTEDGLTIPWLEWILLRGDEIVVASYGINWNPVYQKYSRTEGPIMTPFSGGWRVPPEFSGTADNNFITRAVLYALPAVEQALKTEVLNRV